MCSATPRSLFSITRLCEITLFAASISATAAGQCYYNWEQIPNPPGWWCSGKAINNRGHVAGILSNLGETYRGFIWTPEAGTQMLPLPDGFYDMQVLDINDLDHVVGYAVSQTLGYSGFLWDGKSFTMIPPPPGAQGIIATGINNLDQIVGGANGPFLWENGILTDFGPLVNAPYGAEATAINDRSQILGHAYFGDEERTFVIRGTAIEWLPQEELPLTSATALSNNGFVVGRGATSRFQSATRLGLVWTPHSLERVEPPSPNGRCYFLGINDQARAVGSYYYPDYEGIVWQNQSATELVNLVQDPPFVSQANDINRSGQIIALRSVGTIVLNPVWVTGDLTGDCQVSLDDLMLVLVNFGAPQGSFPCGDINLDGQVDLTDLATLLSHWGV